MLDVFVRLYSGPGNEHDALAAVRRGDCLGNRNRVREHRGFRSNADPLRFFIH